MLNNKNKKGQGLPLQTIVIAILVIIVLLVLIVFFVSKMGSSGSEIDKTSGQYSECSTDNPALSMFNYVRVNELTGNAEKCSDLGDSWISVPGIKDCCASKLTADESTPKSID